MSLTPEQLAARRHTLGASEIAAVCGLDPFRGIWDVWADKLGLIPPESFAASDMGHLFERPLLEHYSRQTGVVLTYPETMIHPLHKWDAGVPEYVVCQVQWEMLVTRRPFAVVVACVGGTDYRVLDVPADTELQETLLDLGRTFWEGHVLTGAPPDPDASEACRRAVAARYRKVSSDMLPASRELIEMAREHKALGKQIGGLEKQREAIGNALRLAIGERAGFEWDTGRCTWAPDKNGNRTLRVSVKGERE